MTSSTQDSDAVRIALAIIGIVGGVALTITLPVTEFLLGKTVPAEQLEEATHSLATANSDKAASESALIAANKQLADTQAALARVQSELDTVNRMVAENRRPPLVERLSIGGSHLFDGTDLKLTLEGVSGTNNELSANILYENVRYSVTPGPTGSASIVTKQDRNCDVAARTVTTDYAILVVDCKATR